MVAARFGHAWHAAGERVAVDLADADLEDLVAILDPLFQPLIEGDGA